MAPLDPPRSHEAAFARDGYVYLAGGLDENPNLNPPSLSDVQRAAIGADGELGAWEDAGKLTTELSVSSAEVIGCQVLLFGGLTDKKKLFSDQIMRGVFDAEGKMTFEILTTKLNVERGHVHQTPTWNGHMYSVAGRGDNLRSIGVVDVVTIAP